MDILSPIVWIIAIQSESNLRLSFWHLSYSLKNSQPENKHMSLVKKRTFPFSTVTQVLEAMPCSGERVYGSLKKHEHNIWGTLTCVQQSVGVYSKDSTGRTEHGRRALKAKNTRSYTPGNNYPIE